MSLAHDRAVDHKTFLKKISQMVRICQNHFEMSFLSGIVTSQSQVIKINSDPTMS